MCLKCEGINSFSFRINIEDGISIINTNNFIFFRFIKNDCIGLNNNKCRNRIIFKHQLLHIWPLDLDKHKLYYLLVKTNEVFYEFELQELLHF